ncbi:hypothetical protein [Actinomycetospora termitidis]|uniref:Uncharacterized protein n=1 Tax=Actinomycetospora termitidis TaxID=3053470 RepID=A0ABT7M346_9PSEU|nr:hypothetical protein [Actinomycetospora sp. Odt1-22]MDL5155088.1 hypothetical protein [Actinomycetospora sp. Odt1-22]
MTAASVSASAQRAAAVRAQWVGSVSPDAAPDAAPVLAADTADVPRADPLAALSLVLDRELVAVRRHRLDVEGRVPAGVARYVDPSQGMLEFVFAGSGASGATGQDTDDEQIVLAVAPGARGDTVVPLLPAPFDDEEGLPVGRRAPFDEVLGDALEDVDRVVGHVERPDEMRGLVLHLGGRMLMIYADLWELRVTLLP